MAETMSVKQMQKVVLDLQKDVEFLKQHLDEVPKEAYVKKIRKIEQRARFLDISDFTNRFKLK